MKVLTDTDQSAIDEMASAFARAIGVTTVPYELQQVGDRQFVKFEVGKEAPLYTWALHRAQQSVDLENPFRGAVGLKVAQKTVAFPSSLEANALLTLLTRSTREVSEGDFGRVYNVPYIPFQNREDHQLAQPASHIVRGRRGVGKSTLIGRAIEILHQTPALVLVLDVQTYSTLVGEDLYREVLYDICQGFSQIREGERSENLRKVAEDILEGKTAINRAPVLIKRALGALIEETDSPAYLFLDDFHLIDFDEQPRLLHYVHASLKGAGGWLKVAGISSLLNVYSPETREGLQVPGDAQFISLDLTLENPEAAESHLRAILGSFLNAVGYSLTQSVIPTRAFRRLVWATAGVPRDFLQMFARAIEHAQRNKHTTVTLSDVNMVIGEFGQQKMDDLVRDARNEADELKIFLRHIEDTCLGEKKVNAFLVRSEDTKARDLVHALSDLRMVHLIHRSITPDKAGQPYEAYIIDYSLFTGFRRRPNVKEMVPAEAQFRAAELRALPKIK